MVYFIMEDALTEENAVDNDAYQAWRNQYLSGSKVLPVQYYSLISSPKPWNVSLPALS